MSSGAGWGSGGVRGVGGFEGGGARVVEAMACSWGSGALAGRGREVLGGAEDRGQLGAWAGSCLLAVACALSGQSSCTIWTGLGVENYGGSSAVVSCKVVRGTEPRVPPLASSW